MVSKYKEGKYQHFFLKRREMQIYCQLIAGEL
jgi:hypothetical protein